MKDTSDAVSQDRVASNHDPQAVNLLGLALNEFARDGRVTGVHCNVCGSVVEINAVGDAAYFADFTCGKFRGALRGI